MDRILRNTVASIGVQISVGSADTNPTPDSATVTITRANGTTVVTDAAATDTGTGEFGYTLTPAQTATLDVLTAVWTITYSGYSQTVTTTVEVVGGFYFTLGEFRARYPDLTTGSYSDETLISYRALAEDLIEEACGVAFVPRSHTETIRTRTAPATVSLSRWPARTVSYALMGDTTLTATDYDIVDQQTLAGTVPWTYNTAGVGALHLTYEHGYDSPPRPVKEAAMVLCKSMMVKGPVDDRVLRAGGEEGGFVSFAPMAPTGIQFVDAIIGQYRMPTVA